MIPIQGSEAKVQHPLTPSNDNHEVTIVPRDKDAYSVIEKHLEQNRIAYRVVPGAIKIVGSNDFFGHLFGVTSGKSPHGHFSYQGALRLEDTIHPYVTAVLGMDTHPVAKPHFRMSPSAESAVYRPLAINIIAKAYQFPNNVTYGGQGQCIALIELGGGYQDDDLSAFYNAAKLKPHPTVVSVGVDGAVNSPGGDADGEVVLDIEVSSCVAPKAKIKVFFAPNTDAGFYDAIVAAGISDKEVTGMSISWGGPENAWTGQAIKAMDQALQEVSLRMTVTVAAGDNGCDDGVGDGQYHVDFPGSSSYVLCCGGTSLSVNSAGAVMSEVVWNETASGNGATGGGESMLFAGRTVADVAGNADPASGYMIRLDGQWIPVGGTSCVSPLFAGLIAQLASAKGHKGAPLILNKAALHANSGKLFRKITVGSNSIGSGLPLYPASVCCGLGVPIGSEFLKMVLAE